MAYVPPVGWSELRVGSAGVPLALAEELHRRIIINHEFPMPVYKKLGLSRDVGARMIRLMKKHGIPSLQRLIVLSLGYPARTNEDIAERFGIPLEAVEHCAERAEEIRCKEPLSTELWEDIDEDTMNQGEIWSRAEAVRLNREGDLA